MSCLSPDATTTITSRPKLTLQTTSLPRTFGSSNTGLSFSFATAPTASPTIRNTFKNAYEVTSPSSATTSPSKAARFNSKPSSPYLLHPTNNLFNHRNPYQLPIGVRSILRNSPLDHSTRRRSGSISAGGNGPNGAGSRRVFFPAKKQVSYRCPLEEEIRTERYTAQHIDLLSPEAVQYENDPQTPPEPSCAHPKTEEETEDSDSSPSSLPETSASGDDTSADEGICGPALSKMERKKRRSMGIERQVRAVALLDGVEADGSSTPQTPRDHRVKRRREWRWTLGPIDNASDNAPDGVSLLTLANSSSESLSLISTSEPGH
ncbi:uncharacterized protein N7515_003597 [Penicillium bovifimosum]|uniref:Uncharacterized protein n=1 Tax=Penicillium bovifimosum TaxID=126998 RepID=A0A9W9L5V6_9EURO|nr:uncharacterized protein N7515_003597 [Penicillium bovifimosum]KAJ5138749.1 hypothetical protein N7515_003597 [Penicillium bovifimosum]